jgi:hypothetical protein
MQKKPIFIIIRHKKIFCRSNPKTILFYTITFPKLLGVHFTSATEKLLRRDVPENGIDLAGYPANLILKAGYRISGEAGYQISGRIFYSKFKVRVKIYINKEP